MFRRDDLTSRQEIVIHVKLILPLPMEEGTRIPAAIVIPLRLRLKLKNSSVEMKRWQNMYDGLKPALPKCWLN